MKIGIAGLGRMGYGMALRLIQGGHHIAAFNRTREKVDELVREGGLGAGTLAELVSFLSPPRIVWLMLPAGDVTNRHIEELSDLLSEGDIVVDGANSHYKDDPVHEKMLASRGIGFLDAGVSGGIWGLKNGFCTMIGGVKEHFDILEPVLKTLAPDNGYMWCGPSGAGHFVKMVHNGIEYAMMQAYAEGFALLQASQYGKTLNMADVASLWNSGSVIRSWLLELCENAMRKDPRLDVPARVNDSGEGRWTVQSAIELGVPLPVITESLYARFRSRQDNNMADRLLSSLRREFGGHDTSGSLSAGPGGISHSGRDRNVMLPGAEKP